MILHDMSKVYVSQIRVSPLTFKGLLKSPAGVKVMIDFSALLSFVDYDIKSTQALGGANYSNTNIEKNISQFIPPDYKTYCSSTVDKVRNFCDTVVIDDTLGIQQCIDNISKSQRNSLNKNIRTSIGKIGNVYRYDSTNINLDKLLNDSKHGMIIFDDSEFLDNTWYEYKPSHTQDMYIENGLVDMFGIRLVSSLDNFSPEYKEKLSTLSDGKSTTSRMDSLPAHRNNAYRFSKFSNNKLYVTKRISLTFDKDEQDYSNERIKQMVQDVLKVYATEFKKVGINMDEMAVERIRTTRLKDHLFYDKNKEYLYKFIDYIEKQNIEVMNAGKGRGLYHIQLVIPAQKPDLEYTINKAGKFIANIKDCEFSSGYYCKEYSYDILSKKLLDGSARYGSINMATDDIKDIKKFILLFSGTPHIHYNFYCPIDVFKRDIHNIKILLDGVE